MKKGQSWRPKEWRVGEVLEIRQHKQVWFNRGPGMVVHVTTDGDDATVNMTQGLRGLPMPEERKQMFIDHALVVVARQAMIGNLDEPEVVTI